MTPIGVGKAQKFDDMHVSFQRRADGRISGVIRFTGWRVEDVEQMMTDLHMDENLMRGLRLVAGAAEPQSSDGGS